MSNYKQQEFDFILRTQQIIKQYDEMQISADQKFEVTLFLNCLVGLFILPQQHWFQKVSMELISDGEWGIREANISFIKNGETKNVKTVARHIRNSISHYNFEVFGNRNGQISEIKFLDYNTRKKRTFEATFPISSFKIFVYKFLDVLKEEMLTQQ